MNLIIRADDVGYTHINNLGVFKTIDEGLVTSADLMLDCEGFDEAVEFLKARPWISVGWHAHFWGKPVLGAEKVPSMVNEQGRFKFRKDKTGALRRTCVYEEVLAECRAQLEQVCEKLGRVPDYTHGRLAVPEGTFEAARMQAAKEFGIPTQFCLKYQFRDGVMGEPQETPSERFKDLDIYMVNQPGTVYKTCYSEKYADRLTYDPAAYTMSNPENCESHRTVIMAWHPGYVDEHIMGESTLHEGRIIDIKALCSPELRQWIKDKRVRLINYRDALYGTDSYQNHLRVIGSDLYMGPRED